MITKPTSGPACFVSAVLFPMCVLLRLQLSLAHTYKPHVRIRKSTNKFDVQSDHSPRTDLPRNLLTRVHQLEEIEQPADSNIQG